MREPSSDSDNDESDSGDEGPGGTLQTLLNAMSTLVDERERKTKRVSKAQNRIMIQNFIKILLFIFGIPTNLG